MHSPLRSRIASLMLLATVPFAAGCGPEVSSHEEELGGGSAALGAVADAHADAGTAPTGTDKVAVCHIPPGNPANAHTIVVGAPAVAAHLRHGDRLGACDAADGGGDDGGGDDGSGDQPDAGTGGDDSCQASGESCGTGSGACCFGLICADTGLCVPQIN
jgi:hypothetical protein